MNNCLVYVNKYFKDHNKTLFYNWFDSEGYMHNTYNCVKPLLLDPVDLYDVFNELITPSYDRAYWINAFENMRKVLNDKNSFKIK